MVLGGYGSVFEVCYRPTADASTRSTGERSLQKLPVLVAPRRSPLDSPFEAGSFPLVLFQYLELRLFYPAMTWAL